MHQKSNNELNSHILVVHVIFTCVSSAAFRIIIGDFNWLEIEATTRVLAMILYFCHTMMTAILLLVLVEPFLLMMRYRTY